MEPNHLHLHVRDVTRAVAFYRRWFGLRLGPVHDGGALRFVVSRRGFDLALMRDRRPAPMPRWFHLGFRQPSAAAVGALHRRMRAARLAVSPAPHAEPGFASFRVRDPDGYAIEIYWESRAFRRG